MLNLKLKKKNTLQKLRSYKLLSVSSFVATIEAFSSEFFSETCSAASASLPGSGLLSLVVLTCIIGLPAVLALLFGSFYSYYCACPAKALKVIKNSITGHKKIK